MPDAGPNAVGTGAGAGTTVNVAWSRKGMGDAEYNEGAAKAIYLFIYFKYSVSAWEVHAFG